MSSSSLLGRRLYRSLLQTSRNFQDKSKFCLLHRTGFEDDEWEETLRNTQDRNNALQTQRRKPDFFRTLLEEVVSCGTIPRQLQWPATCRPQILREVIHREFRRETAQLSPQDRRTIAFWALKELNRKLSFATIDSDPLSSQAALGVKPYMGALQPGVFLLAHPFLAGFFHRSVVCLLSHRDETHSSHQGTYGLVVNRYSQASSNKSITVKEALNPLPTELESTIGNIRVKNGGPVQMSLQVMVSANSDVASTIGGSLLAPPPDHDTSLDDRAVYYRSDIMKVAELIESHELDLDDVSFFAGASTWSVGQLEEEIARGTWFLCTGSPTIAQSGVCALDTKEGRPQADLWLSMMSALGHDEAIGPYRLSPRRRPRRTM